MKQVQLPEALRGAGKRARKQGWTITQNRRNPHLRWESPEGTVVWTPSTPNGGKHSRGNSLAQLRAAGLR